MAHPLRFYLPTPATTTNTTTIHTMDNTLVITDPRSSDGLHHDYNFFNYNSSSGCDNDSSSNSVNSPSSPTMPPVSSSSSPSSQPLFSSPQPTLLPASSSSHEPHHQQQPSFPDPIVFQYVLYYPGNLPLVITAGHGGSVQPGEVVTRKKTHRFKRIPDLTTTTDLIEISSFTEPFYPSSQSDPATGDAAILASLSSGEETMPLMSPRDQTKGGNFKRDLNTHALALNLANAISCLTSGASSGPGGAIVPTTDGTSGGGGPCSSSRAGATAARNSNGEDEVTNKMSTSSAAATVTTDHGTNAIPARCEQQGPWGDDESEYPFPIGTFPLPSSTPTRTPTPTPSSVLRQQQQHDSTRRHYRQNYPHVVVFRIPRQYVDVNRNITGENAIAEGDIQAEAAWREYHELIEHIQKMALQKANISVSLHQEQEKDRKHPLRQKHWLPPQAPASGRGLLLDIHGHVHTTNLIEIGYLLNASILNMEDDRFNAYGTRLTKESSIRSLANKVASPSSPSTTGSVDSATLPLEALPFSKLIRGGRTESLGGMLQAQGLNAVPSPEFQAPCQGCVYFSGGYTIQRHGSRNYKFSNLANNDTMDAIQLELPKILRQVEKDQGREVGMKVGRAVVEFAAKYYGLFRESPAIAAREEPDAAVMAAMVKGIPSRSGASTPRRSGATGSGRGVRRTGTNTSGASGEGGVSGQMAHSARLQERLARVQHTHSRAQQQQHHHHHHHRYNTQQAPQPAAQAPMFVSGASTSSSSTTTTFEDSWDNQSGDNNQSGDSEIESDLEKRESVGDPPRYPEIKRQASRL
ncbi:hypothetical protein BGZ96_011449 [Linnemannia gamsii]|uniref:Uncharacterized protein n=1 Tax=Linnemannia gamsii TaxID=64522 RepID=A0ABQ7JSF7_9FUNG|nr:hypothetical protein BGZ96_011449 [Linnemannia gamsii]